MATYNYRWNPAQWANSAAAWSHRPHLTAGRDIDKPNQVERARARDAHELDSNQVRETTNMITSTATTTRPRPNGCHGLTSGLYVPHAGHSLVSNAWPSCDFIGMGARHAQHLESMARVLGSRCLTNVYGIASTLRLWKVDLAAVHRTNLQSKLMLDRAGKLAAKPDMIGNKRRHEAQRGDDDELPHGLQNTKRHQERN